MSTKCECCGLVYPDKHIVVQHFKDGRDNKLYYIPHAIRIFGLFKEPSEIRKKLDQSELTDFLYLFPGEPYHTFYLEAALPYGWRVEHSRKYGIYYWMDNRS